MLNAIDLIRAMPGARRYEIGDILFTQFTCPSGDEPVGVWSQTDHLVHVLSARATWTTLQGTWSVGAGETVFFRKGAFIMPPHFESDLCIMIFFIPDAFVREAVNELAAQLTAAPEPLDLRELAIRVHHDVTLAAFFQSMVAYFAGEEQPPEALLKLKLRELLTSILLGRSNPKLAAYFQSAARHHAPLIPAIMEANFRHNLSLQAFAQMCHRSLSTFKREFRQHYGTTPGRWLLDRRLECAAHLLRSTGMSVTEIVFECGFEEPSHLSRAFRAKFGCSPIEYRGGHGASSSASPRRAVISRA
ncbi:MAG: helix-turn-helix domain-containing protein [Opitutaceae bacterium]